jgi:hypothetical protein
MESDVVIRSDDGVLATKPSSVPALVREDCNGEGRGHRREPSVGRILIDICCTEWNLRLDRRMNKRRVLIIQKILSARMITRSRCVGWIEKRKQNHKRTKKAE